MTLTDYRQMTDEELKARKEWVYVTMMRPWDKDFDKAHEEYQLLMVIERERYYEENIGKLNEFYEEHIKGRTWEEIDPEDWDFYSDYYKDVHGFRPRTI